MTKGYVAPSKKNGIKSEPTQSRRTGEISTGIEDDFDLLSVNHFYNLFDVYYRELCNPAIRVTEEQIIQDAVNPKNLPASFGFRNSYKRL